MRLPLLILVMGQDVPYFLDCSVLLIKCLLNYHILIIDCLLKIITFVFVYLIDFLNEIFTEGIVFLLYCLIVSHFYFCLNFFIKFEKMKFFNFFKLCFEDYFWIKNIQIIISKAFNIYYLWINWNKMHFFWFY